jgi:hypothetical protein
VGAGVGGGSGGGAVEVEQPAVAAITETRSEWLPAESYASTPIVYEVPQRSPVKVYASSSVVAMLESSRNSA